MRTVFIIVRKEFLQIFRNRFMLPIIFIFPVVQLIMFVYAANMDIKELRFCIVDKDYSVYSQKVTSAFKGSPFFRFTGNLINLKEAEEMLFSEKVDLISGRCSGHWVRCILQPEIKDAYPGGFQRNLDYNDEFR